MKGDAERSESVKGLLKGMSVTDMEILSYDKAVKIARDLREFPKEKIRAPFAYNAGAG